MCVWPYFLFLFTLLAQTSTFLSVCGNWESTPAYLLNFNFSLDIFVLFCSFWYRQEKGREVRKQEENGWEERWGEPKSSMSSDYGIHTAAIAPQSSKL